MHIDRPSILGFPRSPNAPFDWSSLFRAQLVTRTFDDPAELFDQLESEPPSDLIVQADTGLMNALKLCHQVLQRAPIRVHLVSRNVSPQEATAAESIGVASVHDVELGYERVADALAEQAGRRPSDSQEREMTTGTLTLDLARRQARVGANPLALTKIEFAILSFLAARPGETISRQTLTAEVWGTGWFGAPNVLDTHLTHLRSKLAAAGHRNAIVTVYRAGFHFDPQVAD